MDIITIDTLDQKMPTLTDNYKLVKTGDIVDKVISLGYNVEKFVALKTKKVERRGYQKHRVLFTSNDLTTALADQGKLQLLMTNSHDGTSSVTFQIGFFRYICANGLVAGDFIGEPVRVRHIGNIEDKIEEAIKIVAERANKLDEAMLKLQSVKLTFERIKEFELRAAQLRYDNVIDAVFPLHRPEDNGQVLFEVFNRVQEGLTKGLGAKITDENGKVKSIRQLRSFMSDSEVNSKLFDLALEFAA